MRIETKNRPRFSPIRNLTPERLTQMLDAFEQGYLAEAALTWDTIEKRDDTIKSVAPKRKKAIARHGWEVIVLPNLPCAQQAEALRHKEALEYFYTNVTCSHALDGNERGGFKLLVRQMMDAVGKRYAVHEIVWKAELVDEGLKVECYQVPGLIHHGDTEDTERLNGGVRGKGEFTEGNEENEESLTADRQDEHGCLTRGKARAKRRCPTYNLTAELRFVPLWFFENTTGTLRFLKSPYAGSYLAGGGEPLTPGAWMITAGEGLMTACSIAWMYKNLPLQDWLDFSHRYGHPALVAATSAARNSSEWLELEKVMEDFLSQLSAMTTAGEQIKLIDLKGGGDLPYERLISRMDRLITALWRGADLSTLSREQGYGASLQAGESDILEQDDAEMISETLQTYLDRHVIEYLFGKGVKPLAAVKILVTPKQSTPQDLQIDEFLINHGARLAINDTLARYGRAEANVGERALERRRDLKVESALTAEKEKKEDGAADDTDQRGLGEGNEGNGKSYGGIRGARGNGEVTADIGLNADTAKNAKERITNEAVNERDLKSGARGATTPYLEIYEHRK